MNAVLTSAYGMIALFALLFSLATAFSTLLLGDRSLLSGNLFSWEWVLRLAFHWKLWLSLALAVGARFSFVAINHYVLKVPALSGAATTLTAFITCIAFFFLVGANMLFLHEQLSLRQAGGCLLILSGVFLMLR